MATLTMNGRYAVSASAAIATMTCRRRTWLGCMTRLLSAAVSRPGRLAQYRQCDRQLAHLLTIAESVPYRRSSPRSSAGEAKGEELADGRLSFPESSLRGANGEDRAASFVDSAIGCNSGER